MPTRFAILSVALLLWPLASLSAQQADSGLVVADRGTIIRFTSADGTRTSGQVLAPFRIGESLRFCTYPASTY